MSSPAVDPTTSTPPSKEPSVANPSPTEKSDMDLAESQRTSLELKEHSNSDPAGLKKIDKKVSAETSMYNSTGDLLKDLEDKSTQSSTDSKTGLLPELATLDWQTQLVWIFLVITGLLQLAGIAIYIYKRILVDPAQWENPLYNYDYGYVYYHIHFAAFLTWMYVLGPILLLSKFQSRWLSLYWSGWFIAAILTVLVLFPIQRSKQQYGFGTFIASGVLANVLQVLGAFVLMFPSSSDQPASGKQLGWFARFRQRRNLRSEYLAFHAFSGYNLATFPWKHELLTAKSATIVAVVMFILLAIYIAGSMFMVFGWKTGASRSPQRQRLSQDGGFKSELKSHGARIIAFNVILMAAFVIPILTFFTMCEFCGKDPIS